MVPFILIKQRVDSNSPREREHWENIGKIREDLRGTSGI